MLQHVLVECESDDKTFNSPEHGACFRRVRVISDNDTVGIGVIGLSIDKGTEVSGDVAWFERRNARKIAQMILEVTEEDRKPEATSSPSQEVSPNESPEWWRMRDEMEQRLKIASREELTTLLLYVANALEYSAKLAVLHLKSASPASIEEQNMFYHSISELLELPIIGAAGIRSESGIMERITALIEALA